MPKVMKSTDTENSAQWLREKEWEMTANGLYSFLDGRSKINVKFDNDDGCTRLN